MFMKGCPHQRCVLGLWYLVDQGCTGQVIRDEVNQVRKVWHGDCWQCARNKAPGIGFSVYGKEGIIRLI